MSLDLMLTNRRSGILLHPTSLSGLQPVGSLGQEAYDFVDFLVAARQSVWQILPLGPTGFGDCPYSSFSAFAGNSLLINLDLLVSSGDLQQNDLPEAVPATDRADFGTAVTTLLPVLILAGNNFKQASSSQRQQAFDLFCHEQSHWLNDYAFFAAMRINQDYRNWQQWPVKIRQRQQAALHFWGTNLQKAIYQQKYQQFIFFEQWSTLKRYANVKGVEILGDLPIFVAEDSADVWANFEQFHLDENGQATLVAGVPPDYFSQTGQRWGNPLYRWERMAENNFSWWQERFRWNLKLFDLLRVDHFRGFSSCWTIPAEEPTAENGYWLPAPGEQLFSRLQQVLGALPIIAEDLGIITPEVERLRDQFGFPGMKILQFAFDSGSDNPYLPANHLPNSVVYTGTHDNNTTLGWWQSLNATGKKQVREHLQQSCRNMPWPLIETALASVARLAVIPMQDILSLPATSRMNIPGTSTGNWQWRLHKDALTVAIAEKLNTYSHLYGRNLCITA